MKTRVLFLNPPSHDGRLYNRHVMDPHVSKGDYLYPPYDFLMLSGYFHPSDRFELAIADHVAERVSPAQSAARVRQWKPDAILALTSPQSHTADLAYLEALKRDVGAPLFTLGAVQHSRKRAFLEKHPWMDGVVREPIGDDFARYLGGDSGPFDNLILQGRDAAGPAASDKPNFRFEIPMPRHDLLDLSRYRYPGMLTDRFTSTLASYGCPFKCTYCEAPGFGFRYRTPALVIEELRFIRSLGVREVCFKDWTFAAHRKSGETLLDAMIEADLGMKWFTFSRADVLNADLIRKMKRAGCHTLQIGVETAQKDLLLAYKRAIDKDRLEEVFRTCREEGVSTLATLILGLTGDDEAGIRSTIDYVLDLDPDFASFNIITPLVGSQLREEWEAAGVVDPDVYENQDATRATLKDVTIPAERLLALRDEAVRRFYFRPKYLVRRLASLRTLPQMKSQLAVGWSLFRQHVLHVG
jgi:anaerobic magnesium-protoporphyrin IX monomethyl ester cyclase